MRELCGARGRLSSPCAHGSGAGPTWQEDFVTAMQRLGQLLFVIYTTACGHPAGDRGTDYGLGDLARATCGTMSAPKCIEIFD